MSSAGYSGKFLILKLGIKPEMKILLINEPGNYFDLIETYLSDQICKKKEIPDLKKVPFGKLRVNYQLMLRKM